MLRHFDVVQNLLAYLREKPNVTNKTSLTRIFTNFSFLNERSYFPFGEEDYVKLKAIKIPKVAQKINIAKTATLEEFKNKKLGRNSLKIWLEKQRDELLKMLYQPNDFGDTPIQKMLTLLQQFKIIPDASDPRFEDELVKAYINEFFMMTNRMYAGEPSDNIPPEDIFRRDEFFKKALAEITLESSNLPKIKAKANKQKKMQPIEETPLEVLDPEGKHLRSWQEKTKKLFIEIKAMLSQSQIKSEQAINLWEERIVKMADEAKNEFKKKNSKTEKIIFADKLYYQLTQRSLSEEALRDFLVPNLADFIIQYFKEGRAKVLSDNGINCSRAFNDYQIYCEEKGVLPLHFFPFEREEYVQLRNTFANISACKDLYAEYEKQEEGLANRYTDILSDLSLMDPNGRVSSVWKQFEKKLDAFWFSRTAKGNYVFETLLDALFPKEAGNTAMYKREYRILRNAYHNQFWQLVIQDVILNRKYPENASLSQNQHDVKRDYVNKISGFFQRASKVNDPYEHEVHEAVAVDIALAIADTMTHKAKTRDEVIGDVVTEFIHSSKAFLQDHADELQWGKQCIREFYENLYTVTDHNFYIQIKMKLFGTNNSQHSWVRYREEDDFRRLLVLNLLQRMLAEKKIAAENHTNLVEYALKTDERLLKACHHKDRLEKHRIVSELNLLYEHIMNDGYVKLFIEPSFHSVTQGASSFLKWLHEFFKVPRLHSVAEYYELHDLVFQQLELELKKIIGVEHKGENLIHLGRLLNQVKISVSRILTPKPTAPQIIIDGVFNQATPTASIKKDVQITGLILEQEKNDHGKHISPAA